MSRPWLSIDQFPPAIPLRRASFGWMIEDEDEEEDEDEMGGEIGHAHGHGTEDSLFETAANLCYKSMSYEKPRDSYPPIRRPIH